MTKLTADMQEFPYEEIDDLYRDAILDHYRNAGKKVKIASPDVEHEGYNPFCGDRVVLQLKLTDGVVEEASFYGEGCSISRASASMMTDLLKGRTIEEAQDLAELFRRLMDGLPISEKGELAAFQAVRKFPVRIKCVLLPWTTLEEGIEQHRSGSTSSP